LSEFIATRDLTLDRIPEAFCSWEAIVDFSRTFDPLAERIGSAAGNGIGSVAEYSTVAELRSALYGEYRRYNHRAEHPDSQVIKKAWRVLEWMRRDVAAGRSST
jgi:hypothetical protein